MSKKYSWIKATKESREGKLMRFLQRKENGLELHFIYESLFFLALDNEGKILYEGFEDSFEEEIYYSIDNPLITLKGVRELLNILEDKGLIIRTDGEIELLEFSQRVGAETASSTERVRKHRAKIREQKLKSESEETEDETEDETQGNTGNSECNDVTNPVTGVTKDETKGTNVTLLEKEKEKEREREKEKERDKEIVEFPSPPCEKQRPGESFSQSVKRIVDYLNQETGSSYRASTKSTNRLIQARLKEGHPLEAFEAVIRIKTKQWKNDPKMCMYLRPETLFGTKFEGYVQEALRDERTARDKLTVRTDRPELMGEIGEPNF